MFCNSNGLQKWSNFWKVQWYINVQWCLMILMLKTRSFNNLRSNYPNYWPLIVQRGTRNWRLLLIDWTRIELQFSPFYTIQKFLTIIILQKEWLETSRWKWRFLINSNHWNLRPNRQNSGLKVLQPFCGLAQLDFFYPNSSIARNWLIL